MKLVRTSPPGAWAPYYEVIVEGTKVGHIRAELLPDNHICIHPVLEPEHRYKGLGRQLHDVAETFFAQVGQKLIPARRHSPDSARIWRVRDPNFETTHVTNGYWTVAPPVGVYATAI